MEKLAIRNLLRVSAIALGLSLLGLALNPPSSLAHGGGPMMRLSQSQMPPGGMMVVEAQGFKGAKSVEVVLKGTRGDIPLGNYKVSGEDFSLNISLPADLRPGPYELIIRSGDAVAKERIRIMPGMMGGPGGMGMGPGGMMGGGTMTGGAAPATTQTDTKAAQPPYSPPAENTDVNSASASDTPAKSASPVIPPSSSQPTTPPNLGQPAVAVERPGWLTLTVWVLVVLLVGGGGYLMGVASKLTKTLGQG